MIHSRHSRAAARWPGIAVFIMFAMNASLAPAQESFFHSLAKSAGVAADVDPPADFVATSRPKDPPEPLSVFAPPDEPKSKVKSASDLKKMDADLAGAGKKHDALRSSFPPAAKAMAEADAADRAKAMKKRPVESAAASK